jgi:DNA-directed RNA polymerase subunit RPC12/RpoP
VIGEPVLRDLLGTMLHFQASSAIIVTTGRLTKSAIKWINGKPIRVIRRAELADLIKNNITESDLISKSGKLPEIPNPKVCPECGSKLVKKLRPATQKDKLPPIYLTCPNARTCGYQKRLA